MSSSVHGGDLQYVFNLGLEGNFQFHDVFGLDPDLLGMLPQPCVALLLLFPINKKVKRHTHLSMPCRLLLMVRSTDKPMDTPTYICSYLQLLVLVFSSLIMSKKKSRELIRIVRLFPPLSTLPSKLLGMPVALSDCYML